VVVVALVAPAIREALEVEGVGEEMPELQALLGKEMPEEMEAGLA
jgi:hypothetical protein